jgi:hypothetical protein
MPAFRRASEDFDRSFFDFGRIVLGFQPMSEARKGGMAMLAFDAKQIG